MPDTLPHPETDPRGVARKGESLPDFVREALERMILSGELAPGERLNEVALASRLQVSRGPVREALRALEGEGMVVLGPANRGAHVRRVDAEELAELYDTRALLQGYCCARLAARPDPAALRALRAQVAAMAAAIEAGEADSYYRLNLDFHDALFRAAAHRRTESLYAALLRESHLARRLALRRDENMRDSNAEHAAMLDAVAAGDADAARRLGEEHVLAGKRRWLQALLDPPR